MQLKTDQNRASCRPKVGDIVVLTHVAASQNINDVLKLGVSGRRAGFSLSPSLTLCRYALQVLKPQETGVVLEYDPDSERMHFEVKNNTKGSENFGKKA